MITIDRVWAKISSFISQRTNLFVVSRYKLHIASFFFLVKNHYYKKVPANDSVNHSKQNISLPLWRTHFAKESETTRTKEDITVRNHSARFATPVNV